jgi:hypothetical protein
MEAAQEKRDKAKQSKRGRGKAESPIIASTRQYTYEKRIKDSLGGELG